MTPYYDASIANVTVRDKGHRRHGGGPDLHVISSSAYMPLSNRTLGKASMAQSLSRTDEPTLTE